MSPSDPERVGPYEIECPIGRGGMGVVYRARDPAGRAVAVKCVAIRDDELARRLAREADVRVAHPNVVRVLGSGIDARGEPYVVTELLEGETLEARLRRGIELPALVALFAQAADGLAALHAAGVVHRDVKPSNLFVTREGTIKLLDFGTASVAGAETVLTRTGALVGTPSYLAPEQARGDRAVDARTDVWGLGMSLYRALTGVLPFHRGAAVTTALAVQNDPLPSLYERASHVPLELASIVERCLSKRPDDRPATAAEVGRLLRSVPTTTSGRPSQPLLPRPDETWRTVAVVLLDGIADAGPVAERTRTLGGSLFPILGRAAVAVLGADSSRGDELERAVELALEASPSCTGAVIASARARESGRELEPSSLGTAMTLLERGPEGVILAPDAAAVVGPKLRLERRADGSARVIERAEPAARAPLVGRDAELAILEDAARRAMDGAVVAVEIVGETGMGKTALVRALADRIASLTAGSVVAVARAGAGDTSPYASLLDALELRHVPGTHEGSGGTAQEALDRRRVAVLDRLGELLVGAALVVLVVENVGEADPHTRAFLRELPDILSERPLLVVTTARAADPLAAASTIALEPLGASAIGAIVERVLGPDEARRVAGELAARASGNPLFALHLALLARAKGDASGVSAWDRPATVESAVQARLDALPAELRSATHTMSVLGAEGSLVEARVALGSRADAWIGRLAAAEILERVPRGWQFRSRIVAEVAYAALDAATAERLHRGIATRLAAILEPGAPEGAWVVSPEIVLRHADRGGAEDIATRYAHACFLRAARIGDGRRVLELLPRARAASGSGSSCLFLAAEAAAFVGRGAGPDAGADELLREALAHAVTADERALALAELGERARRSLRLVEARALLDRALEQGGSAAIATRTRCRLALVHLSEGDAARASEILDGLVLSGLPAAVAALAWDTRGYVHGARGELGGRRECYERAAALYAESGDARRAAGANANLGDTLRQMGDLVAAQAALRRAIEGARRVGNGLTEGYACTNLAATLIALGRRREALATLDLAAARAVAVGDRRLAAVVAIYRARAERRAPTVEELDAVRGDATLEASAMALLLEHGAPSEAQLDAAAAILEAADVEEGALEIGRALYARRPSEAVRARILARLDRAHRTLGRPEWQERYRAHVAHALGPELGASWLEHAR